MDKDGVEWIILQVLDQGCLMLLTQATMDDTNRRRIKTDEYDEFEVMWETLDDKATEIAEKLKQDHRKE